MLEALKGNPESVMTVSFDEFVTCSAPAKYQTGDKVIAFLDNNPLEVNYLTHVKSYGVKALNEEALYIYS